MRRKWLSVLGGWLALVLSLILLTGCGNESDENTSDGKVGRSYVHGHLDGAFAAQHLQVFSPRQWNGETDGPVLMSGDTLLGLSESHKTAIRTLIKSGQAVLVTSAKQPHIEALHALTGTPAAVSLDRMSPSYTVVETYGLAHPNGQMRMVIVPPFPIRSEPEPESSKQIRANTVANWFSEQVQGVGNQSMTQSASRATNQSADVVSLSPSPPWLTQIVDTMPAYWSTCGMATQQCVNQAQLFIAAWMVYSADAAAGQPSDFFIMRMSADLSTEGCKDFYGNRNHSTRIAAYWLRQANMSASVPNFSLDELSIPGTDYAPVATNPSNTTTTGVSWSLTGTGTAGLDSDGPSGNLAFGAGVSYSDSNTASYPALDTQVNIGATGSNAASWTYDSWNFVHQSIEPANQACGGPGLNTAAALPGIIYGGTFSPAQSWVWAAQPSVREQQMVGTTAAPTLPVTVDTSLLLGWTYYTAAIQTCTAQFSEGTYAVQDLLSTYYPGTGVDMVGSAGNQSNGLNFDVSCDVKANYGTIPLGSALPGSQDNIHGNPGAPYAFPSWSVNVPFAPTAAASLSLTTLAPTSGSAGTVVTLTGTHLDAATTVNFGGTTITNFSLTPQKTIQVVAPNGAGTTSVSVGNASGISNTLSFTYTQ